MGNPNHPPLPNRLDHPSRPREGCYLLHCAPVGPSLHHAGTLRIQHDGPGVIASGDLYQTGDRPSVSPGIPIFPSGQYRCYLRVTELLPRENGFVLQFERYAYSGGVPDTNKWDDKQTLSAELTRAIAPQGYPKDAEYLQGELKNHSSGVVEGTLAMGWVSPFLRQAVIEIDAVPQAPPPLDNGAGITWETVFPPLGWKIYIERRDKAAVRLPEDEQTIEISALEGIMRRRRGPVDLNKEWLYYLFCGRSCTDTSAGGFMYDNQGRKQREGAAIFCDWEIPWERVRGRRLGDVTGLYFRTAVHEIGHAMNLDDRSAGNTFMATMDIIANAARDQLEFPHNVQWFHTREDQQRLRHNADIWVRPGGIQFYSTN